MEPSRESKFVVEVDTFTDICTYCLTPPSPTVPDLLLLLRVIFYFQCGSSTRRTALSTLFHSPMELSRRTVGRVV